MKEYLRYWLAGYLIVGMTCMQIYAGVWVSRDLKSHLSGCGCVMPNLKEWFLKIFGWSFAWPWMIAAWIQED